jgi:hypothetical protein
VAAIAIALAVLGGGGDGGSGGGATTIAADDIVVSQEHGGPSQLVAAHGDGTSTDLIDEPTAGKASINRARDALVYLRGDGTGGVPYLATDLTEDGFQQDHRLFPVSTNICAHSNRPAWSPEDDRLAIVCLDGAEADQRSLRIATLDGTIGEPLVESSGLVAGPTWADDHTIYYADSSESSSFDALWALPDDGNGQARQVAECEGGAWLINPDWGSPGVLFTCGSTRTAPGQLELLRPDGSVVLLGDEPVAWATWSAEDTAIAALGGEDGRTLVTASFNENGDHAEVGAFHAFDISGVIGEPAWGTR